MAWSLETSCGFESRKIKYLIPRYTRGRGLEIGCGQEKAYAHFIGVDNGHHVAAGYQAQSAADIFAEADDLGLFADDSMDFLFSSHTLEHMEDLGQTLAEWGRVIRPGGHLVLYVPSANLYPKCGEPGANPDHKHDLYPGDIERLLEAGPHFWTIIESEERGEGDEYSLFLVACKGVVAVPPRTKTACVCRFGGFGDMVQMAVILPRLKELGYRVEVMTTPAGQQIVEHDPHIDGWQILDKDQVPNHELSYFIRAQEQRYDLFVNLCESIEGTLLALPGRINHGWPQAMRHKLMNRNYHEMTCDIAGVELKPGRVFYPTAAETATVQKLIATATPAGERVFTVVWALSGSSLHKFSPHQDAVIARMLLEMPEARIFLVGDYYSKVLEQGWEQEPRVIRLAGEQPIRETLALAQQADLVVGPETGVLNAVAFDPVSKVVLLSHSSANNLTKHMVHVQALAPDPREVTCYPCHRLHYDDAYCRRDPATLASACMAGIDPAEIYGAVQRVYFNWRRRS